MLINYYIRTTLDRKLDISYQQIPYQLMIDYNHNCGKAFIEQLKQIKNEDAVLLEDDLILCKDFKKRIEEIIEKHPNDIINFFTYPNKYNKEGYCEDFCYNCCTYFPKEKTKELLRVIETFPVISSSAECIMRNCLSRLRYNHYLYQPPLVQHLDLGSIMNHTRCKFKRRSPYFIDYLNELGITYEEAELEENKEKLMSLMEEKFKELDKNKNQ